MTSGGMWRSANDEWSGPIEDGGSLMLQRFLDPATLASIAGLDLVAKTESDKLLQDDILQRVLEWKAAPREK
jgi:hypothetical protein